MATYEELKKSHPCFGHKKNKGRIHLPVSPGCNIECKFCDRKINDHEMRPGVTGAVLKPEEAVDVVRRALEVADNLTVVGIAGPGDTLATDRALQTFRLIDKEFPHLMKCLSTNGLLLSERAEELLEVGIDSLTVTVNAVDPVIEAQLNSRIIYHGKIYEGVEGAEILIHNQLEGITKLAGSGMTIKVNTVLVPGINDHHIEETAKQVSKAGATIYNIIPLIPNHELKDCAAPNCLQIDGVRAKAGKYIDVFRHCQHCRADAIGVPGGKDYRQQVYQNGNLAFKDTFSHG